MWDKDSKWCRISYGKQKQIDILTKNLIYISETYFTRCIKIRFYFKVNHLPININFELKVNPVTSKRKNFTIRKLKKIKTQLRTNLYYTAMLYLNKWQLRHFNNESVTGIMLNVI